MGDFLYNIFNYARMSDLLLCSYDTSTNLKRSVGETAWQLTRVQTVYGYDVIKITAPPVQAMNIG